MKNVLNDGLYIYAGGVIATVLFSIFSPFAHIYTDMYSFLLDGEIQDITKSIFQLGLLSVTGFSVVFFPIIWILFSGLRFFKKKWNPNYTLITFCIFLIIFFLFISMDFFGASPTGPVH